MRFIPEIASVPLWCTRAGYARQVHEKAATLNPTPYILVEEGLDMLRGV